MPRSNLPLGDAAGYMHVPAHRLLTVSLPGSILSSFRLGSLELKALGWFLISFLVDDFEPYFLIEEHPPPPASDATSHGDSGGTSTTSTPSTIQQPPPPHPHQQRIALTNQVLQDIHQHGTFELGPLRIDAASERAEISVSLRLLPCNSPAPHAADPYYGKRARRVSYASSGPGGPRAGHRGRNNVFLPISGFPRRLMAEDGIGKVLVLSCHISFFPFLFLFLFCNIILRTGGSWGTKR